MYWFYRLFLNLTVDSCPLATGTLSIATRNPRCCPGETLRVATNEAHHVPGGPRLTEADAQMCLHLTAIVLFGVGIAVVPLALGGLWKFGRRLMSR